LYLLKVMGSRQLRRLGLISITLDISELLQGVDASF